MERRGCCRWMRPLFEEELKVQRHLKVSDVTEGAAAAPHTERCYRAAKVQEDSERLDVPQLPLFCR